MQYNLRIVQPKYPFVVLLLFPEGELGIHCMCHFPFSLVTGMSNKLGKALHWGHIKENPNFVSIMIVIKSINNKHLTYTEPRYGIGQLDFLTYTDFTWARQE